MKHLFKFGLVLATAVGLAADLAKADTISFAYSADGGATITSIVPTTVLGNGTASFTGSVAGWTVNTLIGAPAAALALPTLFLSNSINVASSAGGSIILYVTDSGITSPLGLNTFYAGLTSNMIQNASLTLQALLDTSNQTPHTGWTVPPQIGSSVSFTTTGTSTQSGAFNPLGPYSLTAEYIITAGSNGNVNATINVAVPGPILGAGLPGLLAACGGLVMLARRRRQQFA